MKHRNPTDFKVEMHWHFYGECGISISATKYPDDPGTERMHFHDFHELVVVMEGTGRHVLESESYPLFKGSVFLVPPGIVHGYSDFRNCELVNVLFFPEQLLFSWEKLLTIPGIPGLLDEPFRLRPRELEEVRPLLLSMRNERREKKPDFELAMNADFLQLLFALSRFCNNSPNPRPRGVPRLNSILAFLNEHFADASIQVADIAEKNGMTLKTMERLFRKNTGLPPGAFLASLRLERAAELLRNNSELSVTEVAFHCGFSDSAYFSRAFRKKYAESPREYRKKYAAPAPPPRRKHLESDS